MPTETETTREDREMAAKLLFQHPDAPRIRAWVETAEGDIIDFGLAAEAAADFATLRASTWAEAIGAVAARINARMRSASVNQSRATEEGDDARAQRFALRVDLFDDVLADVRALAPASVERVKPPKCRACNDSGMVPDACHDGRPDCVVLHQRPCPYCAAPASVERGGRVVCESSGDDCNAPAAHIDIYRTMTRHRCCGDPGCCRAGGQGWTTAPLADGGTP